MTIPTPLPPTPKIPQIPVPPFYINEHFVINPSWLHWFGDTQYASNLTTRYPGKYKYCGYYHCGLDLGAQWGSEVRAGVFGEVLQAEKSDPFGPYMIEIRLTDPNRAPYEIIVGKPLTIIYGHLTPNLQVQEGEFVSPDTVIGFVGNESGDPKGINNHVHIEITDREYTYNIINFLHPDIQEELIHMATEQDNESTNFHSYDFRTQPSRICRRVSSILYETCP